MFDLKFATGVVLSRLGDGVPTLCGSCCSYLSRNTFITASHCVPEPIGSLEVFFPYAATTQKVLRVERHPTADVALLFAAAIEEDPWAGDFYTTGPEGFPLGQDFITFGYPGVTTPGNGPPGRLLKGHLQQFFSHQPEGGTSYMVGEMSIPAPPGLSGSPLSIARTPQSLIAVVTRNHDCRIELVRSETLKEGPTDFVHEVYREVSFGLAAMLSPLKGWVEEAIGKK